MGRPVTTSQMSRHLHSNTMGRSPNPQAGKTLNGSRSKIGYASIRIRGYSGNDMGHTVRRDTRIAANELETLVAGLGNQKSVERVAVVIRQGCDGQGVRNGYGQR